MSEEKTANRNKDENFDKEAEYTQDVIPLMEKLEEVCEKHGLPFVVHVVCKNSDSEAGGCIIYSTCGRDCFAAKKCAVLGAMASGEIKGKEIFAAAFCAGIAGVLGGDK